jgi:hypothetical protein
MHGCQIKTFCIFVALFKARFPLNRKYRDCGVARVAKIGWLQFLRLRFVRFLRLGDFFDSCDLMKTRLNCPDV